MALLPALATEIVIPVCAVIGLLFSWEQWRHGLHNSNNRIAEESNRDHRIAEESNSDHCIDVEKPLTDTERSEAEAKRNKITTDVSKALQSFLSSGRQYVGGFVVAIAILIFLCLGSVESFSTQSQPCTSDPSKTCKPALATAGFSTVSFLLGALMSFLSGFHGAKFAIYNNASTALEKRNFVGRSSSTAFRSGAFMGFLLAGIDLLVLYLAINLFMLYYGNDWEGLFEAITGYGLGGSSMALFGRASSGIYAKAADVGVHLVEIIEPTIPLDYRNPAVITNYVGDVVGDIAGMGTDLFGSSAESSSAALVVALISSFGTDHDFTAMCYPLLISSMGILVCLFTTHVCKNKHGLNTQLIISTILMNFGIAIVSSIALPSTFTIDYFGSPKPVKNCRLKDFAADYVSGGLASVSIPFFAAISIFVSSTVAGTYGIAVAALGMLSPIATRLAADACGPISNNAIRIAEGVGTLPAAGKTTADIGKGFAIESAALVSIAMIGAFVSRAAISLGDVPRPTFLIGFATGTYLPYRLSAMIMNGVGRAGLKMAKVICPELDNLMGGYNERIYAQCFKILTDASFSGMSLSCALVMLIPLFFGTVFGVEMLSGVLAGSLSSVVQIAISASNNGGAWNKAKEYIKAGASEYMGTLEPKNRNMLRKAANSENTIGDKQKDTSVPPLNILIQLMAVESLVFTPFFARHGGLFFKFLEGGEGTISPL
ncbi:hypothetical protein BT93_G0519 [Corymbia citriodora subsp. variegata]|nr:hypothetical protein BT93_G0519 [Corymbia citriodora subsp. variegata]